MKTYFISDLHLCPQRPDMTAALLTFLNDDACAADALYILGDLFEFWIGDDEQNPLQQQIEQALFRLSQQHVAIYFIHGNRDFLLGQAFAKRAGITLLSDPCVINLYGQRVLLSHGDQFCTLDESYQRFRRFTSLKWLQKLFLTLPLKWRLRVANAMRQQSQQGNRQKSQQLMDVTAEAVQRALQSHDCQVLIHGHTHRPGVHPFEHNQKNCQRIVLGDWFEQGSFLIASANGLFLATRPLPKIH